MSNRTVYASEDRAIRRVFAIRNRFGAWPAYLKVPGGYALTFEPDELTMLATAEPGEDADLAELDCEADLSRALGAQVTGLDDTGDDESLSQTQPEP